MQRDGLAMVGFGLNSGSSVVATGRSLSELTIPLRELILCRQLTPSTNFRKTPHSVMSEGVLAPCRLNWRDSTRTWRSVFRTFHMSMYNFLRSVMHSVCFTLLMALVNVALDERIARGYPRAENCIPIDGFHGANSPTTRCLLCVWHDCTSRLGYTIFSLTWISGVLQLRHIIHDWLDDVCTVILKNIRKAMKPSSILLIRMLSRITSLLSYRWCRALVSTDEYILRSLVRQKDVPDQVRLCILAVIHWCSWMPQAPGPLLSNWGAGALRAHGQDITVLSIMNSKERTFTEMVSLWWAFENALSWPQN